jgi:SAM-dependent methyltransferase
MEATMKSWYGKAKRAYLARLGYDVPDRYTSSFVHYGGGVEAQHIFTQLFSALPAGGRILLVGAMGGRDYFLLENLGYDVTALDIGPQPDIDGIVFGNVEEPLPFPDGSFDGVLIGEVLEHLRDDVGALQNLRRVLRDDGILVVTVPFYNDWEEGHMRIHSPKSGARLLAMGGFDIVDYVERPALGLPIRPVNVVQHALCIMLYMATGRTLYPVTTRLLGRWAYAMGKRTGLRFVRRHSRSFGAYYACRKAADSALDHVAINRRLYTGHAA